MNKILKRVLIGLAVLLILAVVAVLILIKPISMSIYNDNFGKRLLHPKHGPGALRILMVFSVINILFHLIKGKC